jgi:hypothetical protein
VPDSPNKVTVIVHYYLILNTRYQVTWYHQGIIISTRKYIKKEDKSITLESIFSSLRQGAMDPASTLGRHHEAFARFKELTAYFRVGSRIRT